MTELNKEENTYRNFIHFPARQDKLKETTEDLEFKTGLIDSIRDSNEPLIHQYLGRAQDVNFIDQRGAGPIHYAITHCDLPLLDLLRRLAQTGADVNLITYEGDNALNLLIKTQEHKKRKNMMDITAKLLEWGADVNYKDMDRRDAVDLARMNNYNDVFKLLEKYKTPNSNRLKTFRDMVPPRRAEVDFQNTKDWDRGETSRSMRLKTFRDMVPPRHAEVDFQNTKDWNRGERPRPMHQNRANTNKTVEEYKPLTEKEKEIVNKVRNRKKRSGESCEIL